MFLKVCGITRRDDAMHAIEQGATALGFVFWPHTPRCVSPERAADIITALPPDVMAVGVFVDESVQMIQRVIQQTGITAVQLHGSEPPAYAGAFDVPVLRAFTVDAAETEAGTWSEETTLLLDTIDPVHRGGTGLTIDWDRAAALARRRRIVLSGGLTPFNVSDAIGAVRPFGVDVSSGVEESPGIKDLEKVAQFLVKAREAFTQYESCEPRAE
jgi:phosphoribosylanthranilate isomerase